MALRLMPAAAGRHRPAAAPSGLRSLALAQWLGVLCALLATAVYARLLDAAQFSAWAGALALAKGSAMLLDGGLKAVLIRHEQDPAPALLRRLRRLLVPVALAMALAIAAVQGWRWQAGRSDGGQALLMAVYPAAYLLSHPWLLGPLSRLERAQRFGSVGRSEAVALLLEFALPALLIAAGLGPLAAFTIPVLLARGLRVVWLGLSAPPPAQQPVQRPGVALAAAPCGEAPATADAPPALRPLLWAGLGWQAVSALALLRDMAHLWLLGPWFGAGWAGQYAMAGTVCALGTQAAAQTLARMAVPQLCASVPAQRWALVLGQTRRLAGWTLPPLALLPLWFGLADGQWWGQRWQPAAGLLPWLAARMVAGVATTTLGAWLSVARPAWQVAQVHLRWTLLELAAAVLACLWLGPRGLAVAGALSAWGGVLLFLAAAEPQASWRPRLAALLRGLLLRPAIAVAALLALAAAWQPQAWPLWTGLLPLAWLAERRPPRAAAIAGGER